MNRFKHRLISSLLVISVLFNSFYYCTFTVEAKETNNVLEYVEPKEMEPIEEPVEVIEPEKVEVEETKEPEPIEIIEEEPDPLEMEHEYDNHLTKRGGVYHNPYTGLKETWYSQRVLPGGGLKIPGRHVNNEGFVCDEDGYICVASSTYSKGTVIETSRGMGKVYDCGCAPGILDIYTNW